MNIRNLIIAAAIAVAAASSPALAASHHNSRAGFNAYGAAQDATEAMSPDRVQALRDCSEGTSKMRDYTWGVQIGQATGPACNSTVSLNNETAGDSARVSRA